MNARLINYWDSFRGSFWFLPVLMSALAIASALATGVLDTVVADQIKQYAPWIETTPAAARSALSSVASAVITLTGVIFSITVVTVSMASSQYGSRLLRAFMEDSMADFVMGSFVGTALFCLITLRSVRAIEDVPDPFVPHISIAFAMLLGLFCVGLLIFFIHHVAVSIQAPNVVHTVARDLGLTIERLYPDSLNDADPAALGDRQTTDPQDDGVGTESNGPVVAKLPQAVVSVALGQQGYVEGIDYETLAAVARKAEGVLRLLRHAGEFVNETDEVARLETGVLLDEEQRSSVVTHAQSAFVIGACRTPRQDISCSVYEVVDVALRSLSPGINDPMTAMNCIDRLGAALAKLSRRVIPDRSVRDEDGRKLVDVRSVTSSQVIHDAFRQIRQYGAEAVSVAIRLIEALTTIARSATRDDDLIALSEEAHAVRNEFLKHDPESIDRRDFDRRFSVLMEELGTCAAAGNLNVDAVL